ncbi:transposon Tf2-6 polyprotein [Nephila pilipes]|uniref:Transposon Tf2-6 polyprotein n=1 Tax=Nephila pilipes TaxID=299642 RepID=A0A8X6UE26_NEPPI|nr:transposon Tf2-6 polyprotein [Nephila pilipes]GFU22418.1 transposon Tf2-6 polyprotein [Nephila pilipes]
MRVGSSFRVLPKIFFSGKENVSEFLDSIDYGVMFHEIPANLACAYLKGHLIGNARDWFEVIDKVRIYDPRERDEGVVETDGLNGEGSRVESEYSNGLAHEESSKEGQWRGRRVRSKGSTESSNNKERRHRNKRRPPRRLNWRERSVSSSLGPGTRKMTRREPVDESGRSSPGPPRGATDSHRQSTKIKSEARELVESFPITNENYPLAIESLTERYGRKELLIDFYVRELLKLDLSNATKKKQDSLSSLYNKLSTQLRALSSLGVTTDQCGVILYPLAESSLPTHILRSFERQRKNIDSEQSISTLDAIVSFLKSEVQSEEKIKLSRSEILPYERECKYLAESQSTLPSTAELFIQEPNDTCAFCFKVHANRFCKKAFFIPLEEKIAIIKKKGLCRVCLAKRHLASRCQSQITCELCSKRNLKFMCPNIVCNKSDSPKQEVNDKKY